MLPFLKNMYKMEKIDGNKRESNCLFSVEFWRPMTDIRTVLLNVFLSINTLLRMKTTVLYTVLLVIKIPCSYILYSKQQTFIEILVSC